jgi:serine/threonine protein kinase
VIGRTVSHYRILSPLGSGGMGVVYLAEDARLGRQVALKFLPASWSQEAKALERFRVEARAASSLSHPAICAIFDIGQDGDTPFIVMEALKGETLRERITKGAMKVSDVLDIGIQLADALEAAHAQGIVHRDIKPANIFLGDRNRVKVLDFGLAKLMGASSLSVGADTTTPADRTVHSQITQPGTALGTVSYMSPEQARGEQIDSRTDLFSLGAVLYEMVTGAQAFGGSTTAVVYDAILNRAPRSIAHLNPLVPPRLEAVIATALEKDRDLRHQHASDLQAELRRIRRDLDVGSLVSSQSVFTTSRDSVPSVPNTTPPPPAKAAMGWFQKAGLAIALLALIVAAVFFLRQQTAGELAQAPPVQPPGTLPTQPAAPADAAPPVVAPAPAQVPTPETRAESPAPAPVPRPRPIPPPEAPPSQRGAVPPPQAGAGTQTPVTPAQPAPAATTPPPAVSSPVVVPPPVTTPAPEEAKPQPAAAPPPAAAEPAPPPPAPVQPATPPPRAAVTPEPSPPAAPVETDDAAIRRVIRVYEQAIETKNIGLYRSVRPGLTAAAETVLMNSFRQIDSQEIDIRVENLRIDGQTATARLGRRDTLITAGRRQIQNSTQTLRFEKTGAGWIIAE